MEVWKPILDKQVQGRYAVSSMGRVFDLITGRYLTVLDNGAGYKLAGLQRKSKDNVAIRYRHRLVAIAFLPNPKNLPQVAHKDHDRSNNKLSNLKWSTRSDNTKDGVEDGRINAKKRGVVGRLTPDKICEVARLRFFGFGVNEIALTLGVPRTTISSVLNGRSNWSLYSFAFAELSHQEG